MEDIKEDTNVAALKAAMIEAGHAVQRATDDALKRLEATPECQAAAAEARQKEQALALARAGGTPRQQADAFYEYRRASNRVAKMRADAPAADPRVKELWGRLIEAKAALARAEARSATTAPTATTRPDADPADADPADADARPDPDGPPQRSQPEPERKRDPK